MSIGSTSSSPAKTYFALSDSRARCVDSEVPPGQAQYAWPGGLGDEGLLHL